MLNLCRNNKLGKYYVGSSRPGFALLYYLIVVVFVLLENFSCIFVYSMSMYFLYNLWASFNIGNKYKHGYTHWYGAFFKFVGMYLEYKWIIKIKIINNTRESEFANVWPYNKLLLRCGKWPFCTLDWLSLKK